MHREFPRLKAFVLVAALLAAAGHAGAQEAAPPAGKPDKPAAGQTAPAAPPRAHPVHAAKPERVSPPPAIPEQFSPPQEAYASFPDGPEGAAGSAKPSACQQRLAKLAAFRPLPLLAGAGECGAVDAVLLDAVMLPDRTKVTVSPPATLRCSMAEEIAKWVRDDVAPAALRLGAPLRDLDNFDSYECRGRNRVRGATLSEHGRANALDVRAFNLADGRTIALTDVNISRTWREGVREAACARFSTVLGPGSDGAHEEHIHVDLAERRGGYKICEWDVREPAPQAEKPAQPAEKPAPQAENAEPPATSVAALTEPVPLPRPRPAAANAEEPRPRKTR